MNFFWHIWAARLPMMIISCVFLCSSSDAVIFAFSLLSVALAQLSFSRQAPPEPSVYTPQTGLWSVDALARPLHVGILVAALAGLQARSGRSFIAEEAAAVLLASLPLLWFIGVLPPPRALVGWVLEQYNVVVLGGTFAASDAASLLQACLGTLAAGLAYVLLDSVSLVRGIAFAGIVGCVLSMDAWGAAQRLLRRCWVCESGWGMDAVCVF